MAGAWDDAVRESLQRRHNPIPNWRAAHRWISFLRNRLLLARRPMPWTVISNPAPTTRTFPERDQPPIRAIMAKSIGELPYTRVLLCPESLDFILGLLLVAQIPSRGEHGPD